MTCSAIYEPRPAYLDLKPNPNLLLQICSAKELYRSYSVPFYCSSFAMFLTWDIVSQVHQRFKPKVAKRVGRERQCYVVFYSWTDAQTYLSKNINEYTKA